MKLTFAIILAVFGCTLAAPQPQVDRGSVRFNYNDIDILRNDNDNDGLGRYSWAYEQSDGQSHQSQGEIRNEGREDEFIAVKGRYTWVGPDNVNYAVNYVADENGFQPEIEQGPGGGVPPGVVASLLG